jgi:hypothetical protein
MTDKKQFIEELQVSYPNSTYEQENFKTFRRTLEAGEDKEQAFLADKTVISFVSNIAIEYRQDVLNTVLLAQLAANKAYPDNKDLTNWYNEYIRVLSGLGWVIQNKTSNDEKATHGVIEIENVVINIITTAIGGNYVAIIKSALDAFKKLSEASNNKIIAFEKNTHSLNEGSFQIGVADQTNNAISLKVGAFLLSSSETIEQILLFRSSKNDTSLKTITFEGTLNADNYANIRDAVKNKLGVQSLDFVTKLNISPSTTA